MVVISGQNLPPPEPEPIDDTTTAVVPQQQQQQPPPPLPPMPDPNQDLVAFPPVPVSHSTGGAIDTASALTHPSLPSTSADTSAPPEPSPSRAGRAPPIASNADVSDPILDDAMHEVVEQQQPPADPQQPPVAAAAVVPSVGDISDNEQSQTLPNGGDDNVVIETIEMELENLENSELDGCKQAQMYARLMACYMAVGDWKQVLLLHSRTPANVRTDSDFNAVWCVGKPLAMRKFAAANEAYSKATFSDRIKPYLEEVMKRVRSSTFDLIGRAYCKIQERELIAMVGLSDADLRVEIDRRGWSIAGGYVTPCAPSTTTAARGDGNSSTTRCGRESSPSQNIAGSNNNVSNPIGIIVDYASFLEN